MDPDAPQGDAPVIPTEAPTDDAAAVVAALATPAESAEPTEPTPTPVTPPTDAAQADAPQTPQTDVTAPVDSSNLEVADDLSVPQASATPVATLIDQQASIDQPALTPVSVPPSQPADGANIVPSPVRADLPISPPASSIDLQTLERMGEEATHRYMVERIEHLAGHAAKKGHLTRRDVQLLLRVGRSTAQTYLGELVKQGRLLRRGAGHSTEYCWVG